jgi:uncharacterized membrane protein
LADRSSSESAVARTHEEIAGESPRLSAAGRTPRGVVNAAAPWLIAALFASLYSAYSILKHDHFASSALDLGIFDQAVWHYSRFETPASTLRGMPNLLGDHFHPLLALAAPLYWLWDDVRMLLVLQGTLLALSGVPVYWLGRRYFGVAAAAIWTVAYLLFWGLQNVVDFDFHEVALAVPLIAFGIYCIQVERWRLALAFILPLLLVKEDLAMLVAAFGVLYLVHRRWRTGAALIAGSVAWFVLVTSVIIPSIAPDGRFRYWLYSRFGDNLGEAIAGMARHPKEVWSQLVWPRSKLTLVGWLFVPFLCLSIISPIAVLAVPLLASRLLGDYYFGWGRGGHLNGLLAPIVAMAALDGLRRVRDRFGLDRRVVVGLAALVLLANAWQSTSLRGPPDFPLRRLLEPAYWSATSSDEDGRRMLSLVPDGAGVVAQDAIAPHLAHRQRIFLLTPPSLEITSVISRPGPPYGPIDYVAANTRLQCFPLYCDGASVNETFRDTVAAIPGDGYGLVYSRGPWLLFQRGVPDRVPLSAEARAYFGRDITAGGG